MDQRTETAGLVTGWALLLGGCGLLVAATGDPVLRVVGPVPNILLVLCGTLIVRRSDTSAVGWMLVVPGALFPWFYFLEELALTSEARWIDLALSAGMLAVLPLMLLIVVFPTGHYPDRATQWLGRTIAGWIALGVAAEVLRVTLGLSSNDELVWTWVVLGLAVLAVAALANQARLYPDRSRTEQRQFKWFLLAIATIPLYAIAAVLDVSDDVFLVVDGISTSSWPIVIFIAITRHRLYDIDRLISRTVAYALVVGMLAGTYALLVTLLSSLLPTQDRLAVAGTTIVVAALFNPLRRRVHDGVDRRFNRARYQAEQVIERFGRQVQEQTDLARMRNEIHRVIAETIAPTTAGVWEPMAAEREHV